MRKEGGRGGKVRRVELGWEGEEGGGREGGRRGKVRRVELGRDGEEGERGMERIVSIQSVVEAPGGLNTCHVRLFTFAFLM